MIYSKSREGTTESSGATRFSKTAVEVSRLFLQMHETEIIAGKHEKQNQASRNIGQYEYYNCFVNQAVTS